MAVTFINRIGYELEFSDSIGTSVLDVAFVDVVMDLQLP
jgi:hypothetical protein